MANRATRQLACVGFGLVLLAWLSAARAELSPLVYLRYAAAAPEAILIEVEDVDTTFAWRETVVDVAARVVEVHRSASGLRVGDGLRIRYRVATVPRPPGWVGPSQLGKLNAGETVPAFLAPDGEGADAYFRPAARGQSFARWIWDQRHALPGEQE